MSLLGRGAGSHGLKSGLNGCQDQEREEAVCWARPPGPPRDGQHWRDLSSGTPLGSGEVAKHIFTPPARINLAAAHEPSGGDMSALGQLPFFGVEEFRLFSPVYQLRFPSFKREEEATA